MEEEEPVSAVGRGVRGVVRVLGEGLEQPFKTVPGGSPDSCQ